MIILIDNYDSFSYNLYQLVGTIDPDIKVIRNDELTVDEIRALKPSRIILSPGPGFPKDATSVSKRQRHWEKRYRHWVSAWDIRLSAKPMELPFLMQKS